MRIINYITENSDYLFCAWVGLLYGIIFGWLFGRRNK